MCSFYHGSYLFIGEFKGECVWGLDDSVNLCQILHCGRDSRRYVGGGAGVEYR